MFISVNGTDCNASQILDKTNVIPASVSQLEMMCLWWQHFSNESKAFSDWINEKERELEAINLSSSLDPLDENISTVEVSAGRCSITASFTLIKVFIILHEY